MSAGFPCQIVSDPIKHSQTDSTHKHVSARHHPHRHGGNRYDVLHGSLVQALTSSLVVLERLQTALIAIRYSQPGYSYSLQMMGMAMSQSPKNLCNFTQPSETCKHQHLQLTTCFSIVCGSHLKLCSSPFCPPWRDATNYNVHSLVPSILMNDLPY